MQLPEGFVLDTPKRGPVYGAPAKVDPFAAKDEARKDTALSFDAQRLAISEAQLADARAKDAREAETEAAKTADEQAKVTAAKAATASKLRRIMAQINSIEQDAQDNGGWFETGTSGSLARSFLPQGTAGNDLAASLKSIDAENAFSGLQALAEQGIKLTPISNEEVKLAAASVANLDPNQGHESFLKSLRTAKSKYAELLSSVAEGDLQNLGFNLPQNVTEQVRSQYPDAALFYYGSDGIIGYDKADGTHVTLKPKGDGPSGGGNTPNGGGGGLGDAFMAGVGDIVEGGLNNTIGLVSNPLNAGINAAFGTNLGTDLGGAARDALGLERGNPYAEAINKGATGALSMAGGANALARTGTNLGRNVVTNALAQQPIQQGVAGATAGLTAETARQAGLPWYAQLAAGLAGGVGGFKGAQGVANALAPRTSNVSPVMQAAQDQGINLMPADVGGPMVKRLTSAAAQGPVSSGPIIKAAEAANDQFAAATQRTTQGSRIAPDDAGQIVREAGQRFTRDSSAKGNALYTRAEKMAQGVKIKAKGAVQTIDDQIAQLNEGGEVNAPLVAELEKFRNSLANNEGIRIGGMRDIRTGARKAAYNDSLRSTPANRVFGIVADAISADIDAGLSQAGRGNASAAFKTADAYWRDRVEYIDTVLEPIIGKGKSGEQVLQAVEQMAAGKGKGVQTLMKLTRSLDKEELADIQATVIDRMGKATAGAQNADGTKYSASTFLTNWNKMSAKGKTALFPDAATRKNLDDLAVIADSMKEAGRYANHSNTSGGIGGQIVLSGGIGLAGGLPALILGSGAQYASGKLLANPAFAKWLATSKSLPAPVAIKRLDAIAASNPIIANDIASVKQFLNQMPSSPATAAASERDDVEN